ncbi:actin nucleation-promoting factor WASL-like [Anthonomus grandis grandis]|uniref:actin nucleation-promoting factor WASL-like n=1 Tax=Anthonomus grandis grandis TaxID=2921223 RepID=UPI0021660D01|nr:actin nucleation-promoting factor WASL-like [Anthonomus grandis grandis]
MKMPPQPVENQNSSLLSTEENFQVFKLLGNRCQTISTTVVQLFTTVPPHHAQWLKRGTGVLCFVRDNSKKNYFFRLFSLKRNQMMWEHEMYNNMEYVESAPFFHTFEGEEGIIGFNFASQSEAKSFRAVVDQKITMKKRKEEKKARQSAQSQSLRLPQQRNLDFSTKQERSKEKRKRNITKADIGIPMDFVHVSHVGFKSGIGYEGFGETEDPQLKTLFEKAGVSEKQLQDKETMEFIYDFIDKHRNSSVQNTSLPAVPPRGAPRPPSATPRPAPPPPPTERRPSSNETNNNWTRKPCPPSPPRPQKPTNNAVGGPAPPPPPPPPPVTMDNAPPPPPMNGMPPPMMESDGNAALLESIRSGTKLKHVEESRPAPVEDARGDLLSEIRKGISLKKVDEREIRPLDPSPTNTGGIDLAMALRMALEKRALHTCPSEDDDDGSTTSNDDEWD